VQISIYYFLKRFKIRIVCQKKLKKIKINVFKKISVNYKINKIIKIINIKD